MFETQPRNLRQLCDSDRVLNPNLLNGSHAADIDLLTKLGLALDAAGSPKVLLVDMEWVLGAPSSGREIEVWGQVAQSLATARGMQIVSIFDQEKMIEEDLAAVLRSFRALLAPSGQHKNPFWLPEDLAKQGSTDDQLRYYLGQIAPEYAKTAPLESEYTDAARGGAPEWIEPARGPLGTAAQSARWHIYCLGNLEVFTTGAEPVNWRVSGGSPIKTQMLFAYLLTRGARPTHADQIAEVVWPDDSIEEQKRKRLHHTISSLRKVLGGKHTVSRTGQQYALNVPPGSFIDMARFEQLCRRGLALLTHDDLESAYKVYSAAERLYRGDLFENLPVESLDYELEDWCMSRRTWLNSMAAKLNYDMSKVLRQTGRLSEAVRHCQKSLAFDPADENGNLEMVRVLLDQGRLDAVARHVKQFERVCATNGIPFQSTNFVKEYRKILKQ